RDARSASSARSEGVRSKPMASTSRVSSASGSSTPACGAAEARRRRSNSSRLISATGLGFALFMLNCVLAKAKRAAEAKRAVETNARAADNHSARDGRPQRPRSAHLLRRPDAQNGERRFERLPNAGRKRKSRLRYTSFFF